MAITSNTYTGNGSNKLFSITFPYLETSDIDVYLNGTLQTITTQYFFANATTVEFVAAPSNGATVKLDRSTDDSDNPATFFPGSSIKAADLNENFDQTLYVVQELGNQLSNKVNKSGDTMSGNLAMSGNKVTGLGTTSSATDAATKQYVDDNALLYSGSPAFTQDGAGAVTRSWSSKLKDTVSVKDFGAVGDGVTDDRLAIQAALNASRFVYFPTPTVSYYITDSVSPLANTTIFGDGAASHIQVMDGTVNCFYLNGVSGVVVRDLKISTKLQTNATAYKCAVLMANECRNCLVENVQVFNWGHWGVAIFSSSNCIVRGCRFSSWFGTAGDSAQIVIYKTSNNNLIEGNYCSAATDHGIFMQDPYAGDTPTGNSIVNN